MIKTAELKMLEEIRKIDAERNTLAWWSNSAAVTWWPKKFPGKMSQSTGIPLSEGQYWLQTNWIRRWKGVTSWLPLQLKRNQAACTNSRVQINTDEPDVLLRSLSKSGWDRFILSAASEAKYSVLSTEL